MSDAHDVVNENAVRAAAGITLVIAAVGFCYSYFQKEYVPLRIVSSFFLVEFIIRTQFGIRVSPVGIVATWATRRYRPEMVSAGPKMFAWYLGMGMALAMTVITNSGIHGWLPRSMCLVCLSLMWLESALGLCLGCEIHRQLVKRGWATHDDHTMCAGGVCQIPQRPVVG